MIFDPQLVQVMRRYSRPLSSPHLHCQSPIEYLTKSSEQVSRKSENGKMLVKTDCKPWFARSSGSRFICRKRSYDLRWTSIRFGMGSDVVIREKSFRLPFFAGGCCWLRALSIGVVLAISSCLGDFYLATPWGAGRVQGLL